MKKCARCNIYPVIFLRHDEPPFIQCQSCRQTIITPTNTDPERLWNENQKLIEHDRQNIRQRNEWSGFIIIIIALIVFWIILLSL